MNTGMDMQAVIDAARQGVTPVNWPVSIAEVIYLPNGNGGQGAFVPVERFHPTPARKRGTVIVFDAAGFNQVLRDNADAGDCAVYLDRNPEAPVIEAVLNGHGKGGPGWGDLRVKIEFRATPQWAKWRAIDGKLLDQAAFAEFIEDNIADIETPAGATMLEIATQFQAMRTTAFRKAIRLSSGQVQFENVENIDAKVGAGQIAVPEELTLALAPLQGSPVFRVPARFRYRLSAEGKLVLGVKLQRLEDLMREVIEDVVKRIEVGANVSIIEGRAPGVVTPAA